MEWIKFLLAPYLLVWSGLATAQSGVVPLEISIEHNIIYVTLQVNGEPALFIVDTGAGISIIDHTQAGAYRFVCHPERGAGKLHGMGGQSEFTLTSRLAVSYRGTRLKHLRFFASDIDELKRFLATREKEILGIVGADFLQRHRAVIDYGENKLYIRTE